MSLNALEQTRTFRISHRFGGDSVADVDDEGEVYLASRTFDDGHTMARNRDNRQHYVVGLKAMLQVCMGWGGGGVVGEVVARCVNVAARVTWKQRVCGAHARPIFIVYLFCAFLMHLWTCT